MCGGLNSFIWQRILTGNLDPRLDRAYNFSRRIFLVHAADRNPSRRWEGSAHTSRADRRRCIMVRGSGSNARQRKARLCVQRRGGGSLESAAAADDDDDDDDDWRKAVDRPAQCSSAAVARCLLNADRRPHPCCVLHITRLTTDRPTTALAFL